jgi:putative transposase
MSAGFGVGAGSGVARYAYRLRMSASARRALRAEWDRCRWVWNQCVAESKRAHKVGAECGLKHLGKQLTRWRDSQEWLKAGAQVAQQQTVRDFTKSRSRAMKDIRERLPVATRAGFPTFKKKRQADPTLEYTRNGFSLDEGALVLAKGVVVRPVWSRPLPIPPSSVRIYRDSIGHWYASFVVEAQTERLPATGGSVRIDWGVRQIATTTSNDHDLKHPQHGRTAAAKLARYQRMMARRKPVQGHRATRRYHAAKRLAAKAHKKVARQRQQDARVWAKTVARDFEQIAVEDFKPKFLAKSTLARKAADAGIRITKTELLNMAAKHGRRVVLVDPKYTSTDCGNCGARATSRLPLSQRTYTCQVCGHSADRDKNAAQVVLNRAGLNPSSEDGIRPDAA